jgi:GxxExxY protein
MPRKQKRSSRNAANVMVNTVLGHARNVMAALGKGHREKVYHRAMITSLNRLHVPHRSEVMSPIFFMGEVVGFGRCDMIIRNLVVEFKANMQCPKRTSPQLQKYMESLAATERRRFQGLVINFNQRSGKVDVYKDKAGNT